MVCTLSFGEISNIHDGLHIRLASALLNYMAVYIVCTYNISMCHWRKRGYAAFTLIVGHQRQSCRVAYTHRYRNHFTGKQCYAALIESATNIG